MSERTQAGAPLPGGPGDVAGPIPITRPSIGPEELEAVQAPLRSGWLVQGRFVSDLERGLAAFAGAPHAAATSSCTTALHLALVALGVGPGDEVVVPAFTWVSTANVVEYVGARPVFCDIDLSSFNLDLADAAARVGPRTKGLLPVHLFGLCAPMPDVLTLAARHGLWVVEDAACGLGARIEGRHAGTFGAMGCFSFHPRKSITTGEGGAVTTADPALDAQVRTLRDHGASRSDLARHDAPGAFRLADYEVLGFNYRMTDIQGALGAVQMRRASEILARRAAWAHRYLERLAGIDGLALPTTPPGYEHGYQAFVTLVRPEDLGRAAVDAAGARRDALMARLEAAGIATRPGTHAAALTGYYARRYGLRPEDYPRAYAAERLSLALPLYPDMTEAEHEHVCRSLLAAWAAA